MLHPPRQPCALRTFTVAALLAAALPAQAAPSPPWDGAPFAADPAALLSAAASLAAPKGGARDVLLQDVRFHLDEHGALVSVQRLVYRVLATAAASGAASVEASWAPAAQERPRIRARVVGADGAVHALDPAALAEDGAPSSAGRSILAAPLPGAVPGAVVEIEITIRDRAPASEAGGVVRVPLAGADPIRRLRVELSAAARLPLRWRVRGSAARPQVAMAAGQRRVRLERRGVSPTPPAEPGAPRELSPGPEIAFSWGRSWGDVAERAGAPFTAALGAVDLRGPARAAAGEARTRDEIVRRVVAWVHQNVRCTGLPLAEARPAPAAPSETLQRRGGDGKDLALLLVALLRADGVDAQPALVRSAWDEIVPELPGTGGFDHVLVRVEGTPPIWIDPSDPGTPPGRLPAALQARLALPLGPGVRGLVRTPSSTADQNGLRIERELLLARLGRGSVVESRELSGAPADAERTLRQALPPDGRDELDQRHARDVLRSEDVVYASVEGGDDPEAPLRVRMEARGSQAVVTGEEGAEPSVPADQVFELLPEALTADPAAPPVPHRTDLFLPLPFRAELAYRVVPPDGFRVRAVPPGSDERFGPVRLRSEFAIGPDGAATARYLLDCQGRRLAAREADALALRIRALRRGRGPAIRVERIAAGLFQEGRAAAALSELRALTSRHPDDVVAAGQHALGLLRMGFRGAAEAEMRRVLRLQPGSGWGYRVLGLVLEHDELGRYRGPGFRRMAALTAYRQAQQLDPGNAATRAQLADLLAHDGAGRAAAEHREAALAEYEGLSRDLGDRSRDPARLELLLEMERFDDAAALARELPPGGIRDAVFLAATAELAGTAGPAIREAERLGDGRARALREAARLEVRSRRYRSAAELARAAAEAAPGEPGLREEAEALARLEPWEEVRERGDQGEWTVRRLLYVAATSSDPAREVAPLLARRLPEASADMVHRSLTTPFSALRRSSAEQGLSRAVLADLLLSGLALERDGDPAAGERLRVRLAPDRRAPALTLFLVPEGTEKRILATDVAWPVLAGEADRCAAAGDVIGGRRWLAYAADALGKPAEEGSPAALLAALAPAAADAAPADVRLATAALLAFGDAEARTVPALLAARRHARDAARRRALGFALAAAYRAAERWPELQGVAADLLQQDPASRAAAGLRALALARLGSAEALRAMAGEALGKLSEDPEAAASVAGAQLAAGDLAGSLATHRRIIAAGKAGPGVYNDAAWLELFLGAPGPDALAWARAATRSANPGHAALNTLAAVHALLGQPAEARDALVRSLDAAGTDPPTPADWLAQGLVAEACGLPALARESYARVTPEPGDAAAPYLLARIRLAALDAPPPASPPTAPEAAPSPPAPQPPLPPPQPPRKREPDRPRAPARPGRAAQA